VYADISAAGLNEALKIRLLVVVEYVAGGVEEDDGGERSQRVFGEIRGVFGVDGFESASFGQVSYGGDAGFDGLVSEAFGARKDEDLFGGVGGAAGYGKEEG
jgi:hypothetical protein